MSEKSTVARPYAQAIFELARDQGDLKGWSEMLALAAAVAADERVHELMENPLVDRDRFTDLFLGICGDGLTPTAVNMIKVLASNERLAVLPEVAEQYEHLRAEAERTVEAELVSAFPVSDAQRDKVAAALKTRLGRDVNLVCKTDPQLLGGAVVRAGDLVIDGSALGRLEKLAHAMTHA